MYTQRASIHAFISPEMEKYTSNTPVTSGSKPIHTV